MAVKRELRMERRQHWGTDFLQHTTSVGTARLLNFDYGKGGRLSKVNSDRFKGEEDDLFCEYLRSVLQICIEFTARKLVGKCWTFFLIGEVGDAQPMPNNCIQVAVGQLFSK
jgi:hypothetical protein